MQQDLMMTLPAPLYPVGTIVVALIDHQLRFSEVEAVHLRPHIVVDDNGIYFTSEPRWEYQVRVQVKGSDEATPMLIAERTILRRAKEE